MRIFGVLLFLTLAACGDRGSEPPADWTAWSAWVEARYPVGDAEGHGPDPGSDEWARALQQKLRIVDPEGHGPDPGSAEWRAAVQEKISKLAAP